MRKLTFILLTGLCLSWFYCQPPLVRADFIDDFSNQNLDKWQPLNGKHFFWSVSEGQVKVSIIACHTISTQVPKNEWWQLPEAYQVSFKFMAQEWSDKTFAVGMTDDLSNYYDFHFVNHTLVVEQILAANSVQMMVLPFDLELMHEYTVKIVFTAQELSLYMDGQLVFLAPLAWQPYQLGGKFAIRGATGAQCPSTTYYRDVRVTAMTEVTPPPATPTPTPTPIPTPSPTPSFFKQIEPPWATEAYDHFWLDNVAATIADWGCALVSAVNLLQHHGFLTWPDGRLLDPLSLNVWLKAEQDGYVGEGLLNWLAISRLSALLGQYNEQLPALEFTWFSAPNILLREKLLTEVNAGRWQIAQAGQHFTLVTAWLAEQSDFSIIDPLYDSVYLSQLAHPLSSLRLFTPSHTDLSYFLVVLPAGINFSWQSLSGTTIEDVRVTQEQASSANATAPLYQLIYFRQPPTTQLRLLLSKPDDWQLADLAKIKFYFYDQWGGLKLWSLAEVAAEQEQLEKVADWQLTFNLDPQQLEATDIDSWQISLKEESQEFNLLLNQFLAVLDEAFSRDQLSFYHFYQIHHLAEIIRADQRLKPLMQQLLDFYQLPFSWP